MPCSRVSRASWIGPVGRAPGQVADVVEPADLGSGGGRRRVRPRRWPSFIRGELVRVGVAHAGDPAVGAGAGHPKHPRLVRAEPDLDIVRRRRPGLRASNGSTYPQAGALAPDHILPDHVEGLLQRVTPSPRRHLAPALRGDALPEPTRAQPELDPPPAHPVERRHARGQHDGRPQREVGDVGRQLHVGGLGGGRTAASTRPATAAGTGGPASSRCPAPDVGEPRQGTTARPPRPPA